MNRRRKHMGGGHGLMSFEKGTHLKWHYNWSGLNYCSSVITKHNTNYLDESTNLAKQSSGADGNYENAVSFDGNNDTELCEELEDIVYKLAMILQEEN